MVLTIHKSQLTRENGRNGWQFAGENPEGETIVVTIWEGTSEWNIRYTRGPNRIFLEETSGPQILPEFAGPLGNFTVQYVELNRSQIP